MHGALLARVDVEAEQHRGEVRPAPRRALLRGRTVGGRRQVEAGPVASGGRLLVGVVLDGSSRTSGAPVSTWLPVITSELTDLRRERRAQHRLHLHALQHQHRRAGRDHVADRDRRRHHQGRARASGARRPRRG